MDPFKNILTFVASLTSEHIKSPVEEFAGENVVYVVPNLE